MTAFPQTPLTQGRLPANAGSLEHPDCARVHAQAATTAPGFAGLSSGSERAVHCPGRSIY
ncbi:hypothetical protein ARTHRO9AX_200057 [Arthrobacter sp. 9AX]|nr:hypothetical protein ARTHRO9AX_200057 [Arthrobacter sp. 9AX]